MSSQARMTRLVPAWHIRITNFGLGYTLLTLVVAIAATNSGNNGLYLVLASLLAVLAVSGIVSRRNIRAVEAMVESSGELFAGRPGGLCLTVRNRSNRLTAQGVFFLHEALPGPLYLDPLRPKEVRRLELEAVFPARGAFTSGDAGTMSRFPVGLFRKYAGAKFLREIVVYPNPHRSALPSRTDEVTSGASQRSTQRGSGAETRTLRDFVAGDDPRNLHWKQSARMRKWIVREREAERSRSVTFVVDNATAHPLSPAQVERIERAISQAAGEALALLSRGGEAGLAARGISIRPAGGPAQRRTLLEALARLPILSLDSAPAIPAARRGEFRREVAA